MAFDRSARKSQGMFPYNRDDLGVKCLVHKTEKGELRGAVWAVSNVFDFERAVHVELSTITTPLEFSTLGICALQYCLFAVVGRGKLPARWPMREVRSRVKIVVLYTTHAVI